jgi:hypothetical protein
MALVIYLALLAVACLAAMRDWRRGWLLLPLFGILQDPVRKMTAGTPVVISFSIMALYVAVLIGARSTLIAHLRELSRRFGTVYLAFMPVAFFLLLALVNGLSTFGLQAWQVPALSLALYVAPIPAIVVGYAFLQREEALYRFFRIYAALTSFALVGTVMEYFRVRLPVIGIVGMQFDYIRHLGGLQIRLLSGFYRAPDIMSWHAAMLTAIALIMAIRAGSRRPIWIGAAAWGFLNCILSGRRKSVYFVLAFAAVFVWRYFRRLQIRQLVALAMVVLSIGAIMQSLASDEMTSVYTRGARASNLEIAYRLEGGVRETFRQFGLMGAGLGAATQGTYHLAAGRRKVGWQEGGLGKLAVELGLPGLLAVAVFGFVLLRMLLRLTAIGDVPGSSQLARVGLFSLFIANVVTFAASAQAYTDGVLALMTTFLTGCLLATAALDERLVEQQRVAAPDAGPGTAPAPA